MFKELGFAMATISDFSMASTSQEQSILGIFLMTPWVQGFSDTWMPQLGIIPQLIVQATHKGNHTFKK
jgi:hypothetical protein